MKKATKIIMTVLVILLAAAGTVFAILHVKSRQPDSAVVRTLETLVSYKAQECGFLSSKDPADQSAGIRGLASDKLEGTETTDSFREQYLLSDLPARLAKLTYETENDIRIGRLMLDTEGVSKGEYTFEFHLKLTAGDRKAEIKGVVIAVQTEKGWMCDYIAVTDTDWNAENDGISG